MASINAPISLPPPPSGWQHKPAVRYGDWNSVRHCAELSEKVKDQEQNVDDIERLLRVRPTPLTRTLDVILCVPAGILWLSYLSIKIGIRLLRHFGIIPKPAPVPPKPLTFDEAVKQAVKEAFDVDAQRKKRDSLRQKYQQDCLEPAPQEAPVKAKVASAFWATTPFQVMGAAQQLGHDLDNVAQSPLVAPVIGAVTFAGLTVGAFLRLRNGFDTSGFPILAQRLILQ